MARERAGELRRQQRRRMLEVHPAERLEEGVAHGQVARIAIVEQRHVAVAHVGAVGGAVAALVPDLEGVPGEVAAGAGLDLCPHRVAGERRVVVLPAARVADERRGLKGEHAEAQVAAVADRLRHLLHVARRHRHVVRQVAANAVLALQPREQRAEAGAVGVELGLVLDVPDPATSEHHRVEVPRERELPEARGAVRTDRERDEVVVVEVPVGHRHRLASMAAHGVERGGVVVRGEQRHLAADELRVLAHPAPRPQERHLAVDLRDRVPPVDRDAVGVARVVARSAGEVAAREDAVRALAARGAAAERLVRGLDVVRKLVPAALERRLGLGMDWSGGQFEAPEPVAQRPGHAPASPSSSANTSSTWLQPVCSRNCELRP